MQKLSVKTLPVGPLETNCHILADKETKDAVIIDPGAETDKILSIINTENLNLKAVLLTHGHGDHIGAVPKIISEKNTKLLIHKDDAVMLSDAERNLSAMLGFSITSEHPYTELSDGDVLTFGSLRVEVLHTPGHTRGGVCFFVPNEDAPILFSGDTLFCGDVGRCDLPGGSWESLKNSIITKLYSLPENTVVYPGHGTASTIGKEKISNNYVKAV